MIIRRADRIVAVSEARRAALTAAGCGPEQVVTVLNAVMLLRWRQRTRELAERPSGFTTSVPWSPRLGD